MKNNTFDKIVNMVVIVIFFLVGFYVGVLIEGKPMSEQEFEYCEKVAADIYQQKDNFLIEVPDNIIFEKTDSKIVVGIEHIAQDVTANLKNGELVFTRNYKTISGVVIKSLFGCLFVCIWLLLKPCINSRAKKKKEKKSTSN